MTAVRDIARHGNCCCCCAEDAAALQQQLQPNPENAAVASEASGVLGTSFYISPEIADGWPQYDNKVDLYSLGVIAFELWHPFATAMERVVVLRDLVEKGAMPPGWPQSHPVVSVNHSISQSINQSVSQSTNQSTSEPISNSISQSTLVSCGLVKGVDRQ